MSKAKTVLRSHLRLVEGGPVAERATRTYDIIAKVLGEHKDNDPDAALREALNDIYTELSISDGELLIALTQCEAEGIIGREDRVYLFVLFVVVRETDNAVMQQLRADIISRELHIQGLEGLIRSAAVPEPIQDYLIQGLSRLAFGFTRRKLNDH